MAPPLALELKGRSSASSSKKTTPQREDVDPAIGLFALKPLGRHVGVLAPQGSVGGEGLPLGAGDAEVRDPHHPAAVEEQVVRAHVPVHQLEGPPGLRIGQLVRGVQAVAGLKDRVHHRADGREDPARPRTLLHLPQVGAIHVLQHQIGEPVGLADLGRAHHVRVSEQGRVAAFQQEALEKPRILRRRRQEPLDDAPLAVGILGEPHLTHPPLAEGPEQPEVSHRLRGSRCDLLRHTYLQGRQRTPPV